MKYFKFTQISADTGISWAIAQPVSGPSYPDIPGLEISDSIQLAHSPIYYVAEVDDAAEADEANHMFVLTNAEYANEIRAHIEHKLNEEKNSIYNQENDFRNSQFSKYHETASLAGIYKYEQAKELEANADATATEIRAEATARGITAAAMAARIIENHEAFRAKEAKIAGIRGKILDRITAFTFNSDDPASSLTDFNSVDTIGTTTERRPNEAGEMVDTEVDVTVHKYSLSLPTRFQYE